MKKINFAQIDNACFSIARKIEQQSPNGFVIAAVSRGGLVPAVIISHYLNYKDIRFIRLSSYDDKEKTQTRIADSTCDEVPDTPHTYIIDDICDSGETLRYLRRKYPSANIFTLINKNPQLQPDYAPLTEDSGVWVHFPWEVEDCE